MGILEKTKAIVVSEPIKVDPRDEHYWEVVRESCRVDPNSIMDGLHDYYERSGWLAYWQSGADLIKTRRDDHGQLMDYYPDGRVLPQGGVQPSFAGLFLVMLIFFGLPAACVLFALARVGLR